METEEHLSVKVDGEDSNAIILPGRKKNKNKNKEKKDKVSKMLKPVSNQKLSKSQKRKLKKLEEEKEKAILLSKSIEALEKYKIRDEVYSLMWSSCNLGQVETFREKRQREMQFSKAGLDLPDDDQPFKKRSIDNTYPKVEHDYDGTHSNQTVNGYEPTQVKREIVSNMSISARSSKELFLNERTGASCGNNDIPVKEVSNENTELSMPECLQLPLFRCSYNDKETKKSKGNAHENQKVNNRIMSEQAISPSERTLSELVQKEQGPSVQPAAVVHVSGLEEDENQKAKLSSTSILGKSLQERTLTAPTIVHVSRPKAVENQRKDLPIVMMEQEIMEAINESASVIICGETGCGKTTQVPQFLYEAGFGSRHSNVRGGIIGVTQPRRVAVLATAKRVAFELGLPLGKEVGFQVRHDRRIGDNCSIKFMTDGILLREVQSDFLLKRYSIIILDEAHERSLNTDILIGMLSRVIRLRQREYEEQQKKVLSGENVEPENRIYPLKLVLMSATLRVEDFISGRRIFHVPPPVIEVPTRQYPVTIHFSKRTELVDYIGQAYKKVLSIHKRLPNGGILVFVTGQREVEYLCRKLRKASRCINEKAFRGRNELTSVSGENSAEVSDIKEINEAFEIQPNSSHEVTGRLNSYDEEHEDLSEGESDFSDDLEDESDLEASSDDEDLLNQRSRGSDSNLVNLLQEDGNLESLKAAFEALGGKRACNSDSEGKNVLSLAPEDGSKDSISGKTMKVTNAPAVGPMCVLPLYAMLPASAQLRVFEEVKEGERLVVVATNVAETSLTIPGIKYVVDTGREKSKNFNSSNGMETYEIRWISKASAAQRAGRAGRTGPGHCYRLYSSAAFSKFPDFSSAEISKVPVDGVVLLMKSMHIDKVANFPFPTPPEATAIIEAEHCLKVLEALDIQGRLTPLGKAMARYPMSPRHSRMLLTVIQIIQNMKGYARANLVLGYAVAVAAALSLQNPFDEKGELDQDERSGSVQNEKTLDKEEKLKRKKLKEKAKLSRARFSNPTSDALTTAYALQCFELSGDPVEFCNDNALHLKTMEEMSKLRKQLLQLIFSSNFSDLQQEFLWTQGGVDDIENVWRVSKDKNPLLPNEEEILGQAICAGWADRVAKRIKSIAGLSEGDRKVNAVRYQACMVKETVFLHRRSSLSKFAPEFLVYSELLETKRPYIRGATGVKSDWLVKYARPMCSFSSPHSDPKPYYDPVTEQVLCWVTPNFGPHLWQLPLHGIPIKDDMDRVAVFAYSLLEGQVLPCLKSVRKFMAASPASILRPEASGVKRVGNLLNKLKSRGRVIASCSMLKKLWEEDPRELFIEIQDWFQGGFHNQLEELWTEMHHEVLLDPKDRFPRKLRKGKRRMNDHL